MIFVKIGCPDTSDFEVLLWYLPKAIRANRKLQVGVSSTTSHALRRGSATDVIVNYPGRLESLSGPYISDKIPQTITRDETQAFKNISRLGQ